MDEALALPSDKDVLVAIRTQQMIAHESGVTHSVDPLGGSYLVEALTEEMERRAYQYFERIQALGGVVRGAHASNETVEVACALARKLGKEPVVCRDTSYGFLANRAYFAMANEAIQMVWEKVAPPEEIDRALKLGYNLPIGPLELMDSVGGWALQATSEQDAMRELGPEKGHLHPLVRMMIRAGYTRTYDFWREVLSKW